MQIKRSDKPTDPTTKWVFNPTPFVITAHFGADRVGGIDVIFQPLDAKKFYEDRDESGQMVLVPIPNYGAALMTREEKWGKEGLMLVDFDDPALNVPGIIRESLNRVERLWRNYWNQLEQINSFRRSKNEMPLAENQWLCPDATHPEWHNRPWLEIAKEHLEAIARQREQVEKKLVRPKFDRAAGEDDLELHRQNQISMEQQKRAKVEEKLTVAEQENKRLRELLGDFAPASEPAEATA